MVRLFVGGLPPGTTCQQLQQRFTVFGVVTSCEVVPPKKYASLLDEGYHRGFGFVELEPHDEQTLRKCMSAYNGSTWRGHVLKCKVAKPAYMQRLQQEWDEECCGQGLAEAQKRKLPPLEPGVKLRIRHPSRPTTVEVELGSGRRVTNFPPPPHITADTRPLSRSWEPLPLPPKAQYTFEGRLRELAAQLHEEEDSDDDGYHLHSRGAAISLKYPPGSTAPSKPPAAGAVNAVRQAQRRRQQGVTPMPQQAQQPAEKKRKVVDFTGGDGLEERGVAAAKVDLSRFGSDSEGEGVEAVAMLPAHASGSAMKYPQPTAEPVQLASRSKQHQKWMLETQQQSQQQAVLRQVQQQRQQQAHVEQVPQTVLTVRKSMGKVADFTEQDEEQPQHGKQQTAADLSMFASDSKREGPDMDRGSPSIETRHSAAVRHSQVSKQQQRSQGQHKAKHIFAPETVGALQGDAAPAEEPQPEQHAVSHQEPAQQTHQGSKRAVINFLTPQDQQLLSRRAAVDLSRFGSDSEDDDYYDRPMVQKQTQHDRDRIIPQFDGAWDSQDEGRGGTSREGEDGGAASSSSGGSSTSSEGQYASSSSSSSDDSNSDSGSSSDEQEEYAGGDAAPASTAGKSPAPSAQREAPDENEAPVREGDEGEGKSQGEAGTRTASMPASQQQAPAPKWMAPLLPAGAAFMRLEKLEQIEAQWRVGREGWAQDYRTKHRQAVRHLSRPAGKKQRWK